MGKRDFALDDHGPPPLTNLGEVAEVGGGWLGGGVDLLGGHVTFAICRAGGTLIVRPGPANVRMSGQLPGPANVVAKRPKDARGGRRDG